MLPLMASIVILTKNAGPSFRRTLEIIFNQETDWPYEVIAVDSGSSDETLDLLSAFSVHVHRINPASFNFGRTRNLGFSLARGTNIITISQDVIPIGRNWLTELCKPFEDPNVAAVQGLCRPPEGGNVFFWEQKGLFYFSSDSKQWGKKYGLGLSFVNCAIRRSFWKERPIRATPFSEDKLFQIEIARAAKKIITTKKADVLHGHQYSLRTLMTRLMGEGTGWRHAGVEYTFRDCIRDILQHKWMLRLGVDALTKGLIRSPAELFFPLLRPMCVYVGNHRARIR